MHKVIGINNTEGLSTYLARKVKLVDMMQGLPIKNLWVLPSGPIPPNPSEMLSSTKMKEMLAMLADSFDHVILDSPPLLKVTDPVILSTLVDGVILVVHGGKSTRDILRRARYELSLAGAKIFGVVLNNVDASGEGYDYYYDENYGDQESEIKSQSAGAAGD
jgi:capsular exopolysaccharide synthesis family protein